MAVQRQCPVCGATVASDAPAGHCPRCLCQLGLAAGEAAIESAAVPGESEPPIPPGIRVRYFGDYELLAPIGRGGMGVVFKARQISLNRLVAVKMLLSGGWASPDFEQRFRLEAQAAASLDHPNIVAIHEVGIHEGQHYFSMDYVEGQTLAERARNNPLPPQLAADYLKTIAGAVHYAHQRGILHRDLKPSNILVDSLDRPRITDFGLAKRLTDDSALGIGHSELTITGQMLGSPSYASPEQAAGKSRELTVASDIYSLGAILYEMLTGRPPFRGATPVETLRKVLDEEPARPRALNSALDRDLETICLKCLRKDPRQRYGTAQALAEDLGHWLAGEPIQARLVRWDERLWRWCQRQPVVASLTSGLALALIGGFLATVLEWRRADRANQDTIHVNNRLRAALRQMDSIQLQHAEEYLAKDHRIDALPRWALVLRNNPSNRIAAERLMSTLSHRTWARLTCPPMEHSNRVTSAVFSADSKRVVTSAADNTAWVWDAATGQRLAGPFTHSAEINEAVFSPNGRLVATASRDKTARIWDAITGAPITGPLRYADDVYAVQFSPDSKLVFASGGHVGQFWNASTGQPVGAALDATNFVLDARFSPDGLRLVLACRGRQAQVWDVASGVCLHRFEHGGSVRSVAFSPDGRWLVTASDDKTARVWDLENGLPVGEPLRHEARVWGAEFSPEGERVVTASADHTAQIWDARTSQKIGLPLEHDDGVRSALFSPEGLRVATASADNTVRVWDALTGEPLTEPMVHEANAFSAEFSLDGQRLLTASNGREVTIWDISPAPALTLHDDAPRPWVAEFSPDGKRVVVGAGGDRGKSGVWDALTGNRTALFRQQADLEDSRINCVEFSGDGKSVLLGQAHGWAGVWDTSNRQALASVRKLHVAPIVSAHFSHDRRNFVTASWDRSVKVWNARTGEALTQPLVHHRELNEAEFSPDDKWVLAATFGPVASLWEVRTGQMLREFQHEARVNSAHFSPDGKRILTASSDMTARVWDAQTGALLATLPHTGEVFSARYSPDGQLIVTAHRSDAHSLRVWDAQTFKPLTEPFGDGVSPEFDSDSQRLIDGAVRSGETVRVWDARTGQRLSEPLLQGNPWGFSHFSPDGRLLVLATDMDARIREISPTRMPVPDWLPELAEALAGQRFNGEGMLEPVRPSELWTVQQRVLIWANAQISDRGFPDPQEAGLSERVTRSSNTRTATETSRAPVEDYYGRWAKWFLADASSRTVMPSSPLTLQDYATRLSEQDTFEDSCEALRLQPSNGLIMAGLAGQFLASKERSAPYGEWLAVRATELAPGHAATWWTRANWLFTEHRCAEALQMMARAESLLPNDPKLRNDEAYMMVRCGQWENALVALTKSVDLTSRSTNGAAHLRTDALHARSEVFRHLGRLTEAQADLLEAEGIPERPASMPARLIDLSAHLNIRPTFMCSASQSKDLGAVDFDVRGAIQLASTGIERVDRFPRQVEGIQVKQLCHTLQFLHGVAHHVPPEGTQIGSYVIHFADGQRDEIPIRYGVDLRNCALVSDNRALTGPAMVGWRGTEPRHGPVRLFKRTWLNPKPDVEVVSIDFKSGMTDGALFLVALTAEP